MSTFPSYWTNFVIQNSHFATTLQAEWNRPDIIPLIPGFSRERHLDYLSDLQILTGCQWIISGGSYVSSGPKYPFNEL